MLTLKSALQDVPKIKSEEKFGEIFVSSPSLSQLVASDNYFLAKEFRTSLGIPDYVLLSSDDYRKLSIFANEYRGLRLTGKYAAVVSYLYKKPDSDINDISSLFSETRQQITRSLADLEQWGIVEFEDNSRNRVSINASFRLPELNTVAIELKLSSWEKALWQAVRNGSQFASSYVVMPDDKLQLLRTKTSLFSSNNINTAVFDIESMELTHVTCRSRRPSISSRGYIEALSGLIDNLPELREISV